jgi:DNA-binding transcriptional LysR family regulator
MRGRLHIGCFGPLAARYLPAIVTGFQQQYPEVELVLYEADNDALLTGLQANLYDVVIVYQLDIPATLKLEHLASLKPHVIMAPDHPLASEEKITLKKLAEWPMVLLDLPRSREYFSTLFESRGLYPAISMRSPSFETVRSLVANGAGFSVLVTRPSAKQSYDGKPLIEREIENQIPSTDVVLVHHQNERPTRLHEEFVAYCKANLNA